MKRDHVCFGVVCDLYFLSLNLSGNQALTLDVTDCNRRRFVATRFSLGAARGAGFGIDVGQ